MFFYYLIFSDLKASELAFFSSLLSLLACYKFVFRSFFSSGVSCLDNSEVLDLGLLVLDESWIWIRGSEISSLLSVTFTMSTSSSLSHLSNKESFCINFSLSS